MAIVAMKQDFKGLPDGEVVNLVVSGNTDALDELYDRYATAIFRKCFALLKKREQAQDATHDIFIKAFLGLSKLKDGQTFGKWLSIIAYNYCIDQLRINKKTFTESLDDYYAETADHNSAEKEEKIQKDMELERLEQVFLQLHESDRLLLMMQYQDGMSIKQIQEVLGVGESAVKMRLKRAKEKLSKLYERTLEKAT